MDKAFASQDDMTEKQISFTEVGRDLYAFTAKGDPNSGVIIGDDSVMVIEAQATRRPAQKMADCIRTVTDKPITHLALTHYHATRVLGASTYGAGQILMPDAARGMVQSGARKTGTANSNTSRACFRTMAAFPA